MRIHQLTVEDALQSLHSSRTGLSTAEAQRRLMEYGHNRVESIKARPPAVRFLKGFTHFFALILWVAAALAFLADFLTPSPSGQAEGSDGAGMAALGFAIVGVIVVNALFSFWQEHRAERAMAALQKLMPHEVKVLRDQKVKQLPAEKLVPGDVVLLDDGDSIPADCRLIETFGVRVNSATITGESVPQSRDEHCSTEEELMHSSNLLLAGTIVVAGRGRAVVFATGIRTEFGKIAHLTQDAHEVLSPLQKEIQRLSRLIAFLAVGLGIVFFAIGQALGLSFWVNFLFAIGIIVANVPEGLLPTVTLALAMGSQRMAMKNALIRHLPSVETLGSATVICTDKTGTLTQNRMTVKKLFLDGHFYDMPQGKNGQSWVATHWTFFEAACLCHTLKEIEEKGQRRVQGDPTEIALVEMARHFFTISPEYPRVDEMPFDSDRKRLSTLHRTPAGLSLYTKGALEALLPLSDQALVESKIQPFDAKVRKEFLLAQETLASEGFRVLALAYRSVPEQYQHDHLEEQLVLTGLVALEDPPRPEVPQAVEQCRQAGIKVIMVTGDHPQTAQAIAKQIDLFPASSRSDGGRNGEGVVITGDKLRRMSATQLQLALDHPNILFARVGADQKMRIVQALKAKGHIVAVTGDGVNDAPALRQADIGIAMGQTGTDVARAAADMVLLDDNFASIVAAIEEGRAVFANIRKFLTYILTSNVPELVPYLAFVLFRIPLALTVIQILAVDLGTDMLPALALGAEKPEPGTMRMPPRSRRQRLLDWPLFVRSYLFLGLLEATAAMVAFFFVLVGGGWVYGQLLHSRDVLYLEATTACLAAIVIMQVANVFVCRSERASAFQFGWFSNPWIWPGIATELVLILLICYTPPGHQIFGTAPLGSIVWLFIFPFALVLFGLEECRKWLVSQWWAVAVRNRERNVKSEVVRWRGTTK